MTSRHILKLAKLGAYNTVNFFRVDKGFVAQTADVVYGRLETVPLDARQTVSPHLSYSIFEHLALCRLLFLMAQASNIGSVLFYIPAQSLTVLNFATG